MITSQKYQENDQEHIEIFLGIFPRVFEHTGVQTARYSVKIARK
jgi:hypothetical protein